MSFRFYNSMTRSEEEFRPLEDGKARIYSCGPTVYDRAHIGNFRSYLFSDILRRSLKLGGYKVEHVMNITDVDDKTIRRTLEKNPDPGVADLKQFTDLYTRAFLEDLDRLGIERVEHYPHATDNIEPMLDLVGRLVEKKHAYLLDGSVYFSISTYPEYGKLSGVDLSSVKAGIRYNADEYTKEDVRDFVLWKNEKEHEKISWDSPYGKGRPGWHLECSAMIENIFGGPIDIHTGGIDLLFPHHENEIAQSVNGYGHPFVKQWIHCEHLLVNGKKMSKSEGNFFTLQELLDQGHNPASIRYLLISAHYRQKLNFTLEGLAGIEAIIKKIGHFYDRFSRLKPEESLSGQQTESELLAQAEKWKEQFLTELEDDLNTPRALAVYHEAIRLTNGFLDKTADRISTGLFALLKQTFDSMESVLGLAPLITPREDEVPDEITEKLDQRNQARKNRDFATSDRLRDEIIAAGYDIFDGPDGSRVKKRG